MKKFNAIALLVVGMFAFITSVAAYQSSYTLNNVGDVSYGQSVEMAESKTPIVDWQNNSINSDAQIAVTFNRKKLLRWDNITRIQKWTKGVSRKEFLFDRLEKKGTYRAHIVFNASNDNATIKGDYTLKTA